MKRLLSLALLSCLLSGCVVRAVYDDRELDSGTRPLVATPLSVLRQQPSREQRERPVAIVVHGFSATSWDMEPLANALEQRGVQTSLVTLGAHGLSYDAFSQSDWKVWMAPLVAEYKSLRAQGYKHVYFVGHSTGGTLWLRALADGRLGVVPERMVFVAPLIEFANRTRPIYYAGLLPWLGVEAVDRPTKGTSVGRIYRWRPAGTLQSLSELTAGVRHRLERGLALPARTKVLVVQGDRDEVVDPAGARLLVDHLVGHEARLLMVSSPHHNPMGPDGVQGHHFTPEEEALRDRLFDAIGDHLTR